MNKSKLMDRWAIRYPEKPIFNHEFWGRYQQFQRNWSFSHDRLRELNSRLNEQFAEDGSFSVLVAGSYGRLDAHEKSDLDFMIVHDGHLKDDSAKIDQVRECASSLGISLPNAEGAFSKPIAIDGMINTIGSKEDDLNATARRLLILMEGRPVYNEIYYKNIISRILDHYMRLLSEEPEKEALVLLNDVIKYFRNICINVEFSFWQDEGKWGIRNIKLKHSRILIYTGLLFLIINSSKYRSKKISYLRDHIHLSPIEKIYSVYMENDDYNFDRVIGPYNTFLSKLSSDSVREELNALDYTDRFSSSNYAELKTNSGFLQAEFTRFILDNRMKWTSKIFEYLIF
ncbi:MAG: nucleotidyltransferase domain-containing protein [Desulfobacteraceae bacterium]|nr:nucleotidyltransferase domain-containing protein [Desulfobacteraceae bacterium]